MTTPWTAAQLAALRPDNAPQIPLVKTPDRSALDPERVYWDMWPVQQPGGMPARIGGREVWMALTAPRRDDPGLRHFEAKIHYLERRSGQWHDRGPVLPAWPAPYEREWAGCAMLHNEMLTLFFTAAGTSAKPGGYQQSLWQTSAALGGDGWPADWSEPAPLLAQLSPLYMPADTHDGAPGTIKAFRDPAYFRDPANGAQHLAFTASLGGSEDPFNGAFGLARWQAGAWQLLSPLITADGVNNELERAHLVYHEGRYFAFWSTQTQTFAPHLRHAPTGLYGMVADSLSSPFRPLNGTGLVLANPPHDAQQTYSWFVDASLQVCSFVDLHTSQSVANPAFGGVPAPLLKLAITGDQCQLAPMQERPADAGGD